MPLARMEATIALERLATRMPGLARAGAIRRRASSLIRGPLHFPVRAAALNRPMKVGDRG